MSRAGGDPRRPAGLAPDAAPLVLVALLMAANASVLGRLLAAIGVGPRARADR